MKKNLLLAFFCITFTQIAFSQCPDYVIGTPIFGNCGSVDLTDLGQFGAVDQNDIPPGSVPATYQYFFGAGCTTPVADPTNVTIDGTYCIKKTYTGSGCSDQFTLDITVLDRPAPPTALSATNFVLCQGETPPTFNISIPSGGLLSVSYWFANYNGTDAANVNPLGNFTWPNTTYTPTNLVNPGIYEYSVEYLRLDFPPEDCNSYALNFTVEIKPAPAPPTNTGGNFHICSDDAVPTFTLTSPAGTTTEWYTAPTGGAPFHTGTTYTQSSNAVGSYVYYVGTKAPNGCYSTYRVPVVLAISPQPILTVTKTNETCAVANDGTATINVTNSNTNGGAYQYQWSPNISSSANGTGLQAGTNYTVTVSQTFLTPPPFPIFVETFDGPIQWTLNQYETTPYGNSNDANAWFIDDKESWNSTCGAPDGPGINGDRTLYIHCDGNSSLPGIASGLTCSAFANDGAKYNCGPWSASQDLPWPLPDIPAFKIFSTNTNKSSYLTFPVSIPEGFSNIAVSFSYIAGGEVNEDFGRFRYKIGGGAWIETGPNLQASPTWTCTTINIPELQTGCSNDVDLQVGFRWQNNDDNNGFFTINFFPPGATSPYVRSVAIDDVKILGIPCNVPPITCNNTISFTVSEPAAVPVPSNPQNKTVCVGSTAQLSVTANGMQINWYSALTGGILLQSNSINYTPPAPAIPGTYTYYAEATNTAQNPPTGCKSVRTAVTLTVVGQPDVSVQKTNLSCNGAGNGSITINANSGGPYVYTWASPLNSTLNSVSNLAAGNYTVTVGWQSITGCTTVLNIPITQPNVVKPPTNPQNVNICGSANTLPNPLQVTSASGVTVNWFDASTNGTLLHTGTTYSPAPIPTTNTTYWAERDSAGCKSIRIAVNISVNPAPVVNISGNNSFCTGGSSNLLANISANGPATGMQWQKDNVNIPGAVNAAYTATQAGSYTVIVTNSNGCTGVSPPFIITVTNQAVATLLQPAEIFSCNVPYNLNELVVGTGGGTWSGNAFTTPTGTFSGTNALTYNITYSLTGACAAPAVFGNITVLPSPTLALTVPNLSICANNSPINLSQYVTAGSAYGTWSGTAGVSANTFNPNGLSGNITLTYTPECIDPAKVNPGAVCAAIANPVCGCNGVTYTNGCEALKAGVTSYSMGACVGNAPGGCNLAPQDIIVSIESTPDIQPINDLTNICPTETVDLSTVTIINNGVSGTSNFYNSLSDAQNGLNPINNTVITTNSTYYTGVQTAQGCVDAEPINVLITPCPCPTISNISNNTDVCAGTAIDLSAVINDPANTLDYVEWVLDGVVVGSNNTLNVNPVITGCDPVVFTYTFNVYCLTAQTNPSQTQNITVTYYPLPDAAIVLSAGGCTALAVPTCPTFSIQGANPLTTSTNGDNGDISFSVLNNDAVNAGLSCPISINGNFNCIISNCPTISTAFADKIDVCSREVFTLTAGVLDPDGLLDHIEWVLNDSVVSTSDFKVDSQIVVTCSPQAFNYIVNIYCSNNPTTVYDTRSITITVYPEYDSTLLVSNNPDCEVPTLTSACNYYSITPISVPTSVTEGQSGTATFNVTYNGAQSCFPLQTIQLPYTCPVIPKCPVIDLPIDANTSICNGATPNFVSFQNQVGITNPDNTLASWQWFSDAALSIPFTPADVANSNNCFTVTQVLFLAAICSIDNSVLAAGKLSVTIYPSYSATHIQTATTECEVPTIATNCDNYIITEVSVPVAPLLPGNSGNATWSVTYINNTLNCWAETVTVPYNCPKVCPTALLGNTPPLTACNGTNISMSLTIDPPTALLGSDYSVQWQLNGSDITGATQPEYVATVSASGCDLSTQTYTAIFTCLDPGGAPETFDAGTVTIYPDFEADIVTTAVTECAVPTIQSTCNNYVLTPIDVPANVAPGQSGTASWEVSFLNGNCFMPQTITQSFSCPALECLSINNLLNQSSSICNNGTIDFDGLESQITYIDEDNSLDGFAWFSDAALTVPFVLNNLTNSNACDVANITLYVAAHCSLYGGSYIAAGSLAVTIYPSYSADLIQTNASECSVPTISTNCINYELIPIDVPVIVNAGESGTASWEILYNDNGLNCWTEFYEVPYFCSSPCPIAFINNSVQNTACNGATLSMNVNVLPIEAINGTDYTIKWQLNGVDIAGANELTYTNTANVSGCNTTVQQYQAIYLCALAGSEPQIINAGTVTIYPDYDNSLVQTNTTSCEVPTVVATCNKYSVTPINVPAVVNPGQSGTAVFEINYNGNNCFEPQTISLDYSCPQNPVCFTVTKLVNEDINICKGDGVNFNNFETLITIIDAFNSFDSYAWYSDAGFTAPFTISDLDLLDNCNTKQKTLYVAAICKIGNLKIAAGELNINIYPAYNANLMVATEGNCALPTLTATCPNYAITEINVPTTAPLPGESGTATYTVTYAGNNCWSQPFNIAYYCGDVCPVASISAIAPSMVCNGSNLSMGISVAPNSAVLNTDYSVQWQLNGLNIAGANSLTYNTTAIAPSCDSLLQHYTAIYTCLVPGGVTQTIEAGTTVIYPDYDASFIQTINSACQVPSVTSTCNNYTINPLTVPGVVNPGDNGTATYGVIYANGNCFTEQIISVDYACPLNPQCFTVTSLVNASLFICNGDNVDFTTNESQIVIDDPNANFTNWQLFTDAALTTPFSNNDLLNTDNCTAKTITVYFGAICALNNSMVVGGEINLTIYPSFSVLLLQNSSSECQIPTLISTCSNYVVSEVNVPTNIPQPGESGVASWNITYSASNCWTQPFEVPYTCGDVCPIVAINESAPATACNGAGLNLSVNIAPNTAVLGVDYTIKWQQNGVDIVGANSLTYATTLSALGCDATNVHYTAIYTCLVPGDAPKTIEAGTVSVFPDYDASLVSTTNNNCTVPTASSTCNNYVLTPINVPAAVIPGDNGMATWELNYAAGNCFTATIINVDYTCPLNPECFTVSTLLNTNISICNGDVPNFANLEAQIIIEDTNNNFESWQLFTDAALTTPFVASDLSNADNCNAKTLTIYFGGVCSLDNSIVAGGQAVLTIYPDYSASLVVATEGNCALPTLVSTCANYNITEVNVPLTAPLPGQSGTATYTVTFAGSDCWNEPVDIAYFCGAICPVASINAVAPPVACNGDDLLMSIQVVPNTALLGVDYSVQWQLNGFDIVGANNLTYSTNALPTNCDTIVQHFTAIYTCLVPGNAPQTIEAGTTVIYPNYDASLVQSINPVCEVPSIITTCDNYVVTPVNVPMVVNPGDAGTAEFEISFNNNNCFEIQTINLDYSCPLNPNCLTATEFIDSISICNGNTLTISDFESQAVLNDPDATFANFEWYTDAALNVPYTTAVLNNANNCNTKQITLYLAAVCNLNNSKIKAGTLTVTIYPQVTGIIINNGCTFEVNIPANCDNNLIVKYSNNNGTTWVDSSQVVEGQWQVMAYLNGTPDADADGLPDCPFSSTFEIFAPDNAAFTYPQTSYCSNDANPLPNTIATLGGSFSASNGITINEQTGQIDLLSITQTTTFVVTYTTNGNCPNSSSVELSVIVAALSVNAGADINVCEGETIVLNGTLIGIGSTLWSSNNGAIAAPNQLQTNFIPNGSGTYTILLLGEDACNNNDLDTVLVTVLAPVNLTVSGITELQQGQQTQLTVSGAGNFTWEPPTGLSCNDCTSPIVTINTTTTYTVVSDAQCALPANVTVTLNEKLENILELPNAFSPNADGVNDIFKPLKKGNLVNYNFTIYNRWGQEVFKTTTFSEGWNGIYSTKLCEVGVYVFVIQYQFEGEKPEILKGNVTLVR